MSRREKLVVLAFEFLGVAGFMFALGWMVGAGNV